MSTSSQSSADIGWTRVQAGPTEVTAASRTFVLLHGSWHGAWCWERLSPLLRQAGQRVVAPTLSGLGERASEASRETGLRLHTDQIASLLEEEEVREGVIVGHSYGGMLLTGLADRCPGRIGWLVYMDALLAKDGQSCFDVMPGVEATFRDGAASTGDGWLVPPIDAHDLGITDEADARWVNQRLTPMPIFTHVEKLAAPLGLASTKRRAFILCERFGFHGFADQARAEGFDVVSSLDAGHDVQLTHPRQLAEILLSLA